MSNIKKVAGVYRAPDPHMVGDGFKVQNLFPGGNRLGKRVSPFYLLDYAAPTYFPPSEKPRGVDEHPHKGFETVTIVYQGALEHRDSAGNYGKLAPGDVQWMTAGAGIVHEEKHETDFTRQGGTIEMAQLWVNLPKAHKLAKPGYQTLLDKDIPVVSTGNGSHVRVIAGEFKGHKGPAHTYTQLHVLDVKLKAGQNLTLPFPATYNTGIVTLHGEVEYNDNNRVAATGMALFETSGEEITVTAISDAVLLVLSGEPIDEPVFAYGPFLMNTEAEIREAINEYNSGKMGRIS